MGGQGTDLDVRRLIALVEARPVIWDKSLEEYKCRAAATGAWRQVCAAINPDFNSVDIKEQHNFVKLMMKKWVNVKDSWLRYNKKIWEQKNSTTGGRVVKKYIFNDQLQFLEKNYIHNEALTPFVNNEMEHMYLDLRNESNSTTETGETVSEGDVDRSFEGNISDSSKVDSKFQIYDPQPYCKKLKISENWLSTTITDPVEDRHMSFVRGILPTLRTLSENEVLEFQVGVMQLLKGIKDTQNGRNGNKT